MAAFRLLVAILPQALLMMLVGARFDLLGGLNRSDLGLGILLTLFIVTPVLAVVLLTFEVVRLRRMRPDVDRASAARSRVGVVLAVLLLVEAIFLDLYILSQLRMH